MTWRGIGGGGGGGGAAEQYACPALQQNSSESGLHFPSLWLFYSLFKRYFHLCYCLVVWNAAATVPFPVAVTFSVFAIEFVHVSLLWLYGNLQLHINYYWLGKTRSSLKVALQKLRFARRADLLLFIYLT